MRFNSRRTQLPPPCRASPAPPGSARRASQLLAAAQRAATSRSSTTTTSTATPRRGWSRRASPRSSTPAPMISGRYANLGPEVLAEAGVLLVDNVGQGGWAAIPDDQPIRVHDGRRLRRRRPPCAARAGPSSIREIRTEMDQARSGLAVQLDTLTHNAGEFLRREQDLLLDGRGLPELTTDAQGAAGVVVARFDHAELVPAAPVRPRAGPGRHRGRAAADDLLGLRLGARRRRGDRGRSGGVPSADALQAATDVVLLAQPRRRRPSEPRRSPHRAARRDADAGRDLGHRRGPRAAARRPLRRTPLVGVGLQRAPRGLPRPAPGRAGQHLRHPAQGRLPPRRRHARSRALHQRRRRRRRSSPCSLAGLAAVALAVAVTPVGQELVDAIGDQLGSLL